MFEVVWSDIDSDSILLGVFPNKDEADGFAKTLRPTDETNDDPLIGVVVRPERQPAAVGPSAKWWVSVHYFERGVRFDVDMIAPIGDERILSSGHGKSFSCKVYAPTEADAIRRFEDIFGITFDADAA